MSVFLFLILKRQHKQQNHNPKQHPKNNIQDPIIEKYIIPNPLNVPMYI